MVKILDGKKVRDTIAGEMIKKIARLTKKPKLVIFQVGNNPESQIYIKQKELFGKKLGCIVEHVQVPTRITEHNLVAHIQKYNHDANTHGIIVQFPLPKHLNVFRVSEAIAPKKDVDGLHSENLKKLFAGRQDGFTPATTKGIVSLLDFYAIPIAGKRVVVVGRSLLVGRPTAMAFLNRDATVTVCHTKTRGLKDIIYNADIVIVAVGKSKYIKKGFVKKGHIIVDVGISKTEKGISGDVDFAQVSKIVRAITPVPGGVGPMTVVSLFENLLVAYYMQR